MAKRKRRRDYRVMGTTLEELALEMDKVAEELRHVHPNDPRHDMARTHAKELAGAADLLRDWARHFTG